MAVTAPIIHVELKSADFERSARFYERLFGWQTRPIPEMSYMAFSAAGGPGGGFVKPEMAQASGCLAYLQVDDVDAKLGEIEKAGGRVILGRTQAGDMGSFAIFNDLDGNTVGLWMQASAGKVEPAPAAARAAAAKKGGREKSAKSARPSRPKRR